MQLSIAFAEHDENRGPIITEDNKTGKKRVRDQLVRYDLNSEDSAVLKVAPTQEVINQSHGGVIDMVDICDLERKTVDRTSIQLINQALSYMPDLRIFSCHEVHIYLLSSLGRVSFVVYRG